MLLSGLACTFAKVLRIASSLLTFAIVTGVLTSDMSSDTISDGYLTVRLYSKDLATLRACGQFHIIRTGYTKGPKYYADVGMFPPSEYGKAAQLGETFKGLGLTQITIHSVAL